MALRAPGQRCDLELVTADRDLKNTSCNDITGVPGRVPRLELDSVKGAACIALEAYAGILDRLLVMPLT